MGTSLKERGYRVVPCCTRITTRSTPCARSLGTRPMVPLSFVGWGRDGIFFVFWRLCCVEVEYIEWIQLMLRTQAG